MQCLNVYNLKCIYLCTKMCIPLQWKDKMEHVSMQIFIRYASKQCINNYQIHLWRIIAVLMTFEAKKSIILISYSECPILNALKINKQYS